MASIDLDAMGKGTTATFQGKEWVVVMPKVGQVKAFMELVGGLDSSSSPDAIADAIKSVAPFVLPDMPPETVDQLTISQFMAIFKAVMEDSPDPKAQSSTVAPV